MLESTKADNERVVRLYQAQVSQVPKQRRLILK